jgi:glutamate-1-semialdehyde aminotransferase
MVAAFHRHGIVAQARGEGPVFQLFLQSEAIRDYRDTLAADAGRWTAFCNAMTGHGVYLNGGKLYCSTAHSDADLAATLTATEAVLTQIG